MTVEGDATLRKHLEVAQRVSRRQVARLHLACPEGAQHIWDWFLDLCSGRQRMDRGQPCPLTYSEVSAWAQLLRRRLLPFEVRQLKMLDSLYIQTWRQQNGR